MRHILFAIALCACGGESFTGSEPIGIAGSGSGATGGSGTAGSGAAGSGGKSGASGSGGSTAGATGTGGAAGSGSAGTGVDGSGGATGGSAGAAGTTVDAGSDADECPGPAKWDGPIPPDADSGASTACEPGVSCFWKLPEPLRTGTECKGAPCCVTYYSCGWDWGNGCEGFAG